MYIGILVIHNIYDCKNTMDACMTIPLFFNWPNMSSVVEDAHTNLTNPPYFNANFIQVWTPMHLKLKSMNSLRICKTQL